MAKKNLKHALNCHKARKAQEAKAKAIEEAAKRKALSIKSGKQSRRQKEQIKQKNQKKLHVQPFRADDKILLVGEGNFSFAHSLLIAPCNHSPDLLLATALDSEQECYAKYPDAEGHVKALRQIAGRDSIVAFGVDAGALDDITALSNHSNGETKKYLKSIWNKIVFNFPHVGAGHKDELRNILANQLMLIRFLVSAAPLLSTGQGSSHNSEKTRQRSSGNNESFVQAEEDIDVKDLSDENDPIHTQSRAGSILITLRNVKPYTLWEVPLLAKRLPTIYQSIAKNAPSLGREMKPPSAPQIDRLLLLGHGKSYRVWRSFKFEPKLYPLYSHRRTIGWREGRSKGENEDILRFDEGESRTWEIGLVDV